MWDWVSEKLDTVMRTLTDLSGQMKDLSGHMEATEDHHREVKVSPAILKTSNPARRRSRPQAWPNPHHDVAEEVHRWIAKRMRQLPAYSWATAETLYLKKRIGLHSGEGSR